MFIIVTGSTGSGKTYLATKKLLLKDWQNVIDIYANIEIFTEGFKRFFKRSKDPGENYQFEHIEDTYHLEHGTVLFDDAGKVFNSKRWESISLEFADKLQTARHDFLTFIATAPSIKRIYNEFRQLTHRWFYCECVFKIGNEYFNFFSLHRWCELNIDDIEVVEDDKLARPISKWHYYPIWFGSKKFYDTHAKIKKHKYKMIWATIENRPILTIMPYTMQLKDAMNLWRSLKSGFIQNKPRS